MNTKLIKTFFLCIFLISLFTVGILISSTENEKVSPQARILMGRLYSSSEKERVNAALKLSNYRNESVIESLIHVINTDNSEMVKRVALRSLGRIGDYKAVPVLLEFIESDSISLKVEAMGASINFSTKPLTEALINGSRSKNPIVRQNAIIYLGSLKKNNNKVIDAIINALNDISEGVRVAACKSLEKKREKRAVKNIAKVLLNDKSEIVKEYAAQALGVMYGKGAEDALIIALRDASPLVRITSARSLARLNSKRGLNEAINGIKSVDARIRVMACEIIGLAGNNNSVIFLEQATQDFDRRVQRAAESALKKIKERNSNSAID